MKKKRRFLWWILPVVLIGAAVGALFYFRAHPIQTASAASIDLSKVTTTKVTVGSISTGISATGTVRTSQNATITWGAAGKVAKVLVKKGDQVEADQILAELDGASSSSMITLKANLATAKQNLADLQDVTISVANSQVALLNAQAAVQTAQENIDDLYVKATQAQIDAAYATYLTDIDSVSRAQEAYDKVASYDETDVRRANAASALSAAKQKLVNDTYTLNYLKNYTPDAATLTEYQAALELAKLKLVVAQADYDAAMAGPNAAKIEAAEANIQTIEAQLDEVYLRAPFAGTITSLSVKAGDLVNNGTSALRIDDMSTLYIDLSVSEVDISQVSIDQPVTITFDALTDSAYNGKVSDIGTIGNVANGVANFTVIVAMTDADASVRPGMMSTAEIIVSQVNDVMLVPNNSITTLNQNKIVYTLVNNSQLVPVVVTAGLVGDTETEVTADNLKSGDLVVTNPKTLTTSTATTNSGGMFANLFRALGITTGGGRAGGFIQGEGPTINFEGGAGGPPSGTFPSGDMPPGGNPVIIP